MPLPRPCRTDEVEIMTDTNFEIYAEDWAPSYEPPAAFDFDGTAAVEPAESATFRVVTPPLAGPTAVGFVDGTRRVELGLWQIDSVTGETARGIAGAYAVGGVVTGTGQPARFVGERVGRVCVWGGGRTGDLGPRNGYHWRSVSIASHDPADPLNALQDLMRQAEAALAEELSAAGWFVVLDGPLNRIRSISSMMAGYAKTHQRQLLPDDQHIRIPTLRTGQRCPVWALGSDRYTCYARVGAPSPIGSPWGGIIRLEFPADFGMAAAVTAADLLTSRLPSYAGVAHRDPRAPQNLTPVRNLEQALARRIGNSKISSRTARDAVAAQQRTTGASA
jgi:hypothetical protein